MTEAPADGREAAPEPRHLADWLLARGRHWATTVEVAGLLGIPERNVAPTLAPWRRQGLLFAPTKGLWVMIPAEFRSWRTVPATHFIDAWMQHLGHDYYVALLSAAQVHGFAHQSPQVLQAMTNARLRDREFGRVRVEFTYSRQFADRAADLVNTPTGTMRVSKPETTALDLMTFPHLSGGLSNVATIIGDMLTEGALDARELATMAPAYPASIAQRVGWLLDFMANRVGVEFETAPLLGPASARTTSTLLDPAGARAGDLDERWNVIVNAFPDEESS